MSDGKLFDYERFFPYSSVRGDQATAIEFILDQFINHKKKYVICEAGTGVGKSAIGLTVARYLHSLTIGSPNQTNSRFEVGSYFLTTQKILQDQYTNDFGPPNGPMRSIKSSSNYGCSFHKTNTCCESQALVKTEEQGSKFWNNCVTNCVYKNEKKRFISSSESVTNFSYFLTETAYAKKIKPRTCLVLDESHNIESEMSRFIEISISEHFAKQVLKLDMPEISTQYQAVQWINNIYLPKIKSHIKHIDDMFENDIELKKKVEEMAKLSRQIDLLRGHLSKIETFARVYHNDNWVFNLLDEEGKSKRKLEFKAIDISAFADQYLFSFGEKILMMSATILNHKAFCDSLGIDVNKSAFITLQSPFPIENRPILSVSVGKMSKNNIDDTLPKIVDAIKMILEEHKNEKGIIHCHSYFIANYIKKHVKSKRLLLHDSTDRDEILKKHIASNQPTVLLSPSMTEGVDLHGDLSRFQVVCKVPYPYLGDKICKKRMTKWKWWYPLMTAKTIVQCVGRSIRSETDHAVTYILDSDWEDFYKRNTEMFPKGFRDSLTS